MGGAGEERGEMNKRELNSYANLGWGMRSNCSPLDKGSRGPCEKGGDRARSEIN